MCARKSPYEFVLTVWDNHYYDEEPTPSYYRVDPNDSNTFIGHNTHWKTDQDNCIVEVVSQDPYTIGPNDPNNILPEIPELTGQPFFEPKVIDGAGQRTTLTVPVTANAKRVSIRIHSVENPFAIQLAAFKDVTKDPKDPNQVSISVPFDIILTGDDGLYYVNVYVIGEDQNVYSFYSRSEFRSSDYYILEQKDGVMLEYIGVTEIPFDWLRISYY